MTPTTCPSDLEARALASDNDREAWLAARRSGITATEVRDLARNPSNITDIVAKKHGAAEPDLSHIPAIAHGRAREPIIAAEARDRFLINPESRVFHAADNRRFLASPDGIGVSVATGHLFIAEYKTSGKDIAPGTPAFDDYGYRDQMLWAMRVTGARQCLYGWEQHSGEWPAPTVAEMQFEWIDYDEERVAELEAIALAALDAIDEGEAAPDIDFNIAAAGIAYANALAAEKRARDDKADAKARLEALCAGRAAFQQRSGGALVTWKPPVETTVEVPDEDAARAAHPDLWDALEAARTAWETAAQDYTTTRTKTTGGVNVTARKKD